MFGLNSPTKRLICGNWYAFCLVTITLTLCQTPMALGGVTPAGVQMRNKMSNMLLELIQMVKTAPATQIARVYTQRAANILEDADAGRFPSVSIMESVILQLFKEIEEDSSSSSFAKSLISSEYVGKYKSE